MSSDEPRDSRSSPPANPPQPVAQGDARFARAWRVWLEALAHDPEAAWAAAMTYRSLDTDGRDAWIDALELDVKDLNAPAIALYAPLLAVEEDEGRRSRLHASLHKFTQLASGEFTQVAENQSAARLGQSLVEQPIRTLRGHRGSARVLVVVRPLYLDFVETLVCHLDGDDGFSDVQHEPMCRTADAPRSGVNLNGVEIEPVPTEPLIEELAHAVVAHRRRNRELPEALSRFVQLFSPKPESVGTIGAAPKRTAAEDG